jgi:hypothetical protein
MDCLRIRVLRQTLLGYAVWVEADRIADRIVELNGEPDALPERVQEILS